MRRLRDERIEAGVLERKMLVHVADRAVILRLRAALGRSEQEVAGALAGVAAAALLNPGGMPWSDFILAFAKALNMDPRDVARVMAGESSREPRNEAQLPLPEMAVA